MKGKPSLEANQKRKKREVVCVHTAKVGRMFEGEGLGRLERYQKAWIRVGVPQD